MGLKRLSACWTKDDLRGFKMLINHFVWETVLGHFSFVLWWVSDFHSLTHRTKRFENLKVTHKWKLKIKLKVRAKKKPTECNNVQKRNFTVDWSLWMLSEEVRHHPFPWLYDNKSRTFLHRHATPYEISTLWMLAPHLGWLVTLMSFPQIRWKEAIYLNWCLIHLAWRKLWI